MGRKVLKLAVIVLFLFSFAWICRSILKIVSTEAPDFRILWSIARPLGQGKNLYLNPLVPNPYPPFTSLFYLPLTFLSYPYAQAIFVYLIFASLVISVLMTLKIIFDKIPPWAFLTALSLVLLSFPAKYTLGMGQQNSLAFLLLLFAYYFWKRKIPFLSGIFLALSVSFKPVLGFVGLFFVVEKAWHVIFYAFLAILTEIIVVFSFAHSTSVIDWFRQSLLYLPLSERGVYYNQGFTGFVSRLTSNMILIRDSVILFSITLISTIFLTIRKNRDKSLVFSLLTISVLLLDTLSWQHHFVWLIFPFVLLTVYALRLKNAVLLGLIGIAYLLVGWNFKNPSLYLSFPKILLLSNQFYGAAILWEINVYLIMRAKLTSLSQWKHLRGDRDY